MRSSSTTQVGALHRMEKPVFSISYELLDQWVTSLQPLLTQERFACAVGILRGGAPLALMVSHAIGVPTAFLRYERASGTVTWDSSIPVPPPGSKVLICEDIAGAGRTLADCVAFLKSYDLDVKTMTAGFDDLSSIRPDYSIDGRGYLIQFPWERHAHTDKYREAWQCTKAGRKGSIAEDHEYAAYAIDLDGILLPDVPLASYEADLASALRERDQLEPYRELPPWTCGLPRRSSPVGPKSIGSAPSSGWQHMVSISLPCSCGIQPRMTTHLNKWPNSRRVRPSRWDARISSRVIRSRPFILRSMPLAPGSLVGCRCKAWSIGVGVLLGWLIRMRVSTPDCRSSA